MTELMDDVREISSVSTQRTKNMKLLDRFSGYPLDRPIEFVYLAPQPHPISQFDGPYRSITFTELEDVELDDNAGEWGVFKELVLPAMR